MFSVTFRELEPGLVDFNSLMNEHFNLNVQEIDECFIVLVLDHGRFEPAVEDDCYNIFSDEMREQGIEVTPDNLAKYLSKKTNRTFVTKRFYGYSQGDISVLIYCADVYKYNELDLYGYAPLGCVSEFMRIESPFADGTSPEPIYGFYVVDGCKYNKEELKKELCSYYGDNPDNVTIELFDGYTQIAKYRTI